MLGLAIFLTICSVAVLYLLGFLIMLDSEVKATRKRRTARVERISTSRLQPGSQVNSAPVLTLVHLNSSRQAAAVRPISLDLRGKNPGYKEA
jgi:hypothetical protein